MMIDEKRVYDLALDRIQASKQLTKSAANFKFGKGLLRGAGALASTGLSAYFLVPLIEAGILGAGAGTAAHVVGRRINPLVSDSNSESDLEAVERLERIKYYKNLIKQIDAR